MMKLFVLGKKEFTSEDTIFSNRVVISPTHIHQWNLQNNDTNIRHISCQIICNEDSEWSTGVGHMARWVNEHDNHIPQSSKYLLLYPTSMWTIHHSVLCDLFSRNLSQWASWSGWMGWRSYASHRHHPPGTVVGCMWPSSRLLLRSYGRLLFIACSIYYTGWLFECR